MYKTRVVNNVLNVLDIKFVSQLVYGHVFHFVRSVESIVRAYDVRRHLTPNQPTAAMLCYVIRMKNICFQRENLINFMCVACYTLL